MHAHLLRLQGRLLALAIVLALCTACAAPTGTPAPSASPMPAASATPAPSATPQPTPVPTAVPTATPVPTAAGTPVPTARPTLSPDLLFTGSGYTSSNRGAAFVDGSYYFINPAKGSIIERMAPDGSGRVTLATHACRAMNVVGDWIFYIDDSDRNSLYRMRKDGSGKTKVSAVPTASLLAVDGWLYAAQGGDGQEEVLYRMRADGSARSRFSKVAESCYLFGVADGWFYYVGFGADQDRNLYRSRGDGSKRTKLSDEWLVDPSLWDGHIFTRIRIPAPSDGALVPGTAIYRMELDGTGMTLLFEREGMMGVSIAGGYAYYTADDSDPIFKQHACRVPLSDPAHPELEIWKGTLGMPAFAGERMFVAGSGGAFGWCALDGSGYGSLGP